MINRNEIGQRLREAREKTGLSRDAVIALPEISMSRTTLQQWEIGQTAPALEKIDDLATLYKVSPQWLIFGDETATVITIQEPASDDEYAYIPAYDIEASAGHGAFTDGASQPDKHLAFRCHWIKARGLHTKDLAVIFTKGDSMTPTIPEGSAVVIDQSKTQPLDGKVYVIRIDERLFVKRTQWIPTGGLRLISDNSLYDSFDITKDELENTDIQICGQVIHASYDLPD